MTNPEPKGLGPGAIGILGGTFDPIHRGHLALAAEALALLDLEQVLFVPNAEPPHKQDQRVTVAHHREAMVRLAIDDQPAFVLDRIELERPGPSYAVDTVATLAERCRAQGRPEPWFVLSAEVLDDFHTWRQPERVLELCRIAVAPRPGAEPLDRRWVTQHYPGARIPLHLPARSGAGHRLHGHSCARRRGRAGRRPGACGSPRLHRVEWSVPARGARRGLTQPRTIGLLGGMSWESSIEYERIINTEVRRALGGVHSASLLLRSYDFAAIEELQAAGEWDGAGQLLAADARRLQDAGAGLIVLCTNTMHRVADVIEAAIDVPFLHLADATAVAVRAAGVRDVGLLGTRYTMEQDFYRARLEQHGLNVIVPDEPERTLVHDVIYGELVKGVISPTSKARYLEVIAGLVARGAAGVIAGCTEIELLVGPTDVDLPYFPTTALHASAAARWALTQLEAP